MRPSKKSRRKKPGSDLLALVNGNAFHAVVLQHFASFKPRQFHQKQHFHHTPAELFDLGDELRRTLAALGPDVDREAVAEREIARIKVKWWKGKFDRNRAALAKSVMDSVMAIRDRTGRRDGEEKEQEKEQQR